jgi:hypothetical protein
MTYRAHIADFGAIAGSAGGANAAANDAALALAIADVVKVIEFDPDVYEVSQPVTLNQHAKRLQGIDGNDVFGGPCYGTSLRWYGAPGAAMVNVLPSGSGDLIAPALAGMRLDGNGIAGKGVVTKRVMRPKLENVQVVGLAADPTSIGFYFTGGDLSEGGVACTYRGHFVNLSARVSGGATGIMLDGGPRNTTFCDFIGAHVTHEDGVAFYLRSCDDVHFHNAASSRVLGGTGLSVLLDGLTDYVMGNAFWGLQCGAHDGQTSILSRGNKARQNRIYGLSGVDNQPVITINQGSELYYDYGGGGYTPTLVAEKALARVPKLQIRTY